MSKIEEGLSQQQKKSVEKALKKRGKSLQTCYHRTDFDRIVNTVIPVNIKNVSRDYSWTNENEFNFILEKFNNALKSRDVMSKEGKQRICYVCVGYANTRLNFCSCCYDIEKQNSRELYYVDTIHVSQHRRILCRGCLGYILRQYEITE